MFIGLFLVSLLVVSGCNVQQSPSMKAVGLSDDECVKLLSEGEIENSCEDYYVSLFEGVDKSEFNKLFLEWFTIVSESDADDYKIEEKARIAQDVLALSPKLEEQGSALAMGCTCCVDHGHEEYCSCDNGQCADPCGGDCSGGQVCSYWDPDWAGCCALCLGFGLLLVVGYVYWSD
jgi:hypothetical protein